jgi:hypothetical protein
LKKGYQLMNERYYILTEFIKTPVIGDRLLNKNPPTNVEGFFYTFQELFPMPGGKIIPGLGKSFTIRLLIYCPRFTTLSTKYSVSPRQGKIPFICL